MFREDVVCVVVAAVELGIGGTNDQITPPESKDVEESLGDGVVDGV